MVINIDVERLSYDIVIIADNIQGTTSMVHSVKTRSEIPGLRIHFEKTKPMTDVVMSGEKITIDNNIIQQQTLTNIWYIRLK